MDVRNCRNCGRLFNYLGGMPICPACKQVLEDKFIQVRDYIRENPKASISQISSDNDVPMQQIHQWIREERLEFAEDSPIKINCEICGAPIRTGRYCEKCKKDLTVNLQDAVKKPEPPKKPEPKRPVSESERMRFLK